MITGFKHRGLKRFYERGDTSQVRPDQVDKIQSILTALDIASGPDDMDLPGFRLHPLTGNLRGFWAVTVRANWRIIWRFDGPNAVDVDLTDYH